GSDFVNVALVDGDLFALSRSETNRTPASRSSSRNVIVSPAVRPRRSSRQTTRVPIFPALMLSFQPMGIRERFPPVELPIFCPLRAAAIPAKVLGLVGGCAIQAGLSSSLRASARPMLQLPGRVSSPPARWERNLEG